MFMTIDQKRRKKSATEGATAKFSAMEKCLLMKNMDLTFSFLIQAKTTSQIELSLEFKLSSLLIVNYNHCLMI